MKVSPASGSVVDRAPTTVPLTAFSATAEVERATLVGASLTLVTPTAMVLVKAVSGRVGDPDLDIVAGAGLEVEEAAVGDDDVRAAERKATAGIVEKRVGEGVAGIGIGRRQGADHRAVDGILGHRRGREGHIGGGLVDVGDADGDGLGEGVAGRVGDPDLDIVAGGGLEVEEAAVGDDDVRAR